MHHPSGSVLSEAIFYLDGYLHKRGSMEVKIRRDEDAPESEAEGGTGETKSKNLTGKDRLYAGP